MAEEDIVEDEGRVCKGERRETIEGGFKAGPAMSNAFFPHSFPPVSPFWASTPQRIIPAAHHNVLLPPLTHNPCFAF